MFLALATTTVAAMTAFIVLALTTTLGKRRCVHAFLCEGGSHHRFLPARPRI